jgi:Uma2 family endonuclease
MLPAEITRHRFTVEEYHKMAEAGVFSEDDRVELIEGEVVEMTPIGWRHARCVSNLNMLLARFAGDRYVVSVQNPITVDEYAEPQPDLALVSELPAGRLPGPEEIILVVEVSDTTLPYDRNVKLPIYARAGIPEAWVVEQQGEIVEVHAEPRPNGYARTSRYHSEDDQLRSEILSDLTLPVGEILK